MIYWNPERVLFHIPVLDRPIVWYGVWFVLGYIVGYFLFVQMFQKLIKCKDHPTFKSDRDIALYLTDRVLWYVIAGTLIGARLGHVFFYEWSYYKDHLNEIYQIWRGGLASHGGAVAVILALLLYQKQMVKKFPEIRFLTLLDMIVIPTAFVACCIRIGNFFNQEILGTPTSMPWGVLFGDPIDAAITVPVHPVQLYEALLYLSVFGLLLFLWKWNWIEYTGKLSGLFFILVFGGRFLLEFFKMQQHSMLPDSLFQMGQYLSLPFIALGVCLYFINPLGKLLGKRV